jgi:hypothetical protein
VGIKSDLKIEDKANFTTIIFQLTKNHTDSSQTYMEFIGKCNYVNCLDKDPEEIKLKNQGFDETSGKKINIISDNSKNGFNLDQLSFKNLFNSRYKTIMWIIIIIIAIIIFIIIFIIYYCYCNKTKIAITAATSSPN